jgi:exodeoxyribonuclease-3
MERRGHPFARLGPIGVRRQLPGDPADKQSRYVEAVLTASCRMLVLTEGNPWPGPKFDYKMAWLERLEPHTLPSFGQAIRWCSQRISTWFRTAQNIYSTASWKDNALLQPGPRAAFRKWLKQGWTDPLEPKKGEGTAYTFWSYLRNRWTRNADMRIERLLISKALSPRLMSAGVVKAMRGLEGTSAPCTCLDRGQGLRVAPLTRLFRNQRRSLPAVSVDPPRTGGVIRCTRDVRSRSQSA